MGWGIDGAAWLRHTFRRVARFKVATQIYQEFQWMCGVDSLAGFREKILTCEYWADAWAVEVIQRELCVKLVILRGGVLQIDALPDLPAGWSATGFVALHYNGCHYELLYQAQPRVVMFQFNDLPLGVRRQMGTAGGWFASLGLPVAPAEEDAQPRPEPAAPPAAGPSDGSARGPAAETATKRREGADPHHISDMAGHRSIPDGASDNESDDGDGRQTSAHGCDTTAGLVEYDPEHLDMDRLRARLAEVARRGEGAGGGHPQQAQGGAAGVNWPTQGTHIVDEFSDYGTFAKAFPTLFPRGKGDVTNVENKGSMKLDEWGQYLTRHSAGRFAQHPRFRYYLFNRIQREKALQTGSAFHKKYSGDGVSTVGELKDLLGGGDNALVTKLQWWSQNLRGTPSWKRARRSELRDLISAIGLPTFFVTLSAADLHWRHLHDTIARHAGISPGACTDAAAKMKRVVQNPHIVSAFFAKRAQHIFAEVYGDQLQDSWFVYEWQGRGTVHTHGLLWMRDVPVLPTAVDLVGQAKAGAITQAHCDEGLAVWATYYDGYITGFNPAVISNQQRSGGEVDDYTDEYYACPSVEQLPRLGKHVCAMRMGDLPVADDTKYLANFCNRHTKCRPGVCLKVDRKTNEEYCKSGAPWTRSSTPRFSPSARRRGELEFVPVRNDPWMNNMPRRHFLQWRANADIKPVLSLAALEQYLTKYLTKSGAQFMMPCRPAPYM